MKKYRLFIVILLLFIAQTLFSQTLLGYWEGKIALNKTDSLTIGIFIDSVNNNIHIELDSPDQYSIGQATDNVKFSDSSFSFKIQSLALSFSGNYDLQKQIIDGVLVQYKKSFNILLSKNAKRKTFNRPQTPKPPYLYKTDEIAIRDKNDRYTLISGTLTLPDNPKALVIFITGSGWQDRDETMFAHKPFAVLADALTTAGYATFRYDDFPNAVFQKSTTYDFAEAVNMIIDSLKLRPDIQNLNIGLLGHSEGSLVAFIAASQNPEIDFTIHLGGVALNIYDILTYQIEALAKTDSSFSQHEIDKSIKISQELYKIVIKSKNTDQCIDKLAVKWDKISDKLSDSEREKFEMTAKNKFNTIYSLSTPWYYTLFHIKPIDYIKRISTPVLAISGEKDTQVPANTTLNLMQKYLKKNPKSDFYVMKNLNHLLQPCETGSPKEYSQIETTIDPEVPNIIITWLDNIR